MQRRRQKKPPPRGFDAFHLLRRHGFFGKLSRAHIRRLGALANHHRVRGGKSIFRKGDAANTMFGIRAGAVLLTAPLLEPGAVKPDLIEAGQLFGERALFAGEPRLGDAIAAIDCDLMTIKRRDFHALLRGDPKLALRIIELLGAQLTLSHQRIEEAAYLTVPARLARALLQVAAQDKAKNGRLAFTQQELARAVRSSRESVNKCLRSWMRRKLIRLERGRTTLLDRAALNAIAQGKDHEAAVPPRRAARRRLSG
jgi:CRP-like cAMP-binding protein